MPASVMSQVVRRLRGALAHRDIAELSDGQLLALYLERRDDATFEGLVQRHGAMVLGVCRRLLRHVQCSQDAEDAFQATFLVLLRKAESIRPREMVGNWLHGVAYQVALKARAVAARRASRESQLPAMPEPSIPPADAGDWRPVLDRELHGLPEKYRVPIVLCDLEGKGHEEAARQLGWPVGTLSGRLSRARELLGRRLSRRGVTLSAGTLAAALSSEALAAPPAALVTATVQGLSATASATATTATAALLAEQVLHGMGLAKLKIAVAGLLALMLGGLSAGIVFRLADGRGPNWTGEAAVAPTARQELRFPVIDFSDFNHFDFNQENHDMTSKREMAGWLLVGAAFLGMEQTGTAQDFGRRPNATPEVRGIVKSVEAKAGTITIMTGQTRENVGDKTFSVAKNVEVVTGTMIGRFGLFKEAKLADLSEGTIVMLSLAAGQKDMVESIVAEGPSVRGQLKAVDVKKRTLTVALAPSRREEAEEEKTYLVDAGAEIAVDDGRGRRFSIREAKLEDLTAGSAVGLRLSLDKKHVQSVLAEGPSVFGQVKEIGKKSLTIVTRPARGGEGGEQRSLDIADDALIVLDDGRGRRLSLREGKLADVLPGSSAMARLSADQSQVTFLRIEGPGIGGLLKSVDPKNLSITIAIPKGRGEEPEEKTFTVAKDARIAIDNNNQALLADLKVTDNGPFVMLRLSLDQKTVQAIMARTTGR